MGVVGGVLVLSDNVAAADDKQKNHRRDQKVTQHPQEDGKEQ